MDGRWTALDGRRIYAHATAASHVYQAVLRAELTRRLGVGWTPVVNGIAEVDGVPPEVLRAFSRRRADIEHELAVRGTAGPRAAEAAALATRTAKDHGVDPRRLSAEWRTRCGELGWDPASIAGGRGPVAVDLDDIAGALLGPNGLTSATSTFTGRDVVRAVAGALPAGSPVDALSIERLAARVLARPEVLALAEPGRELFRRRDGRVVRVGPEEVRYTTSELLRFERGVLESAERGRGAGRAVVASGAAQVAVGARRSLADEQRAMVEALTRRGDAVAVVAGRAGTGKTFALAAAREAWEAGGVPVLGAAVARRAAQELERGAGVPSTSVAGLLARLDRAPLPSGGVVIVDEAAMLGTRDVARLVEHTEAARGKLVLVGDHAQLPELRAGGTFRALVERGHAVELHENRRQRNAWERAAVEHLRAGRAAEAVAMYDAHDRIHIEPGPLQAHARLVADWSGHADGDAVMIAARRNDVTELNRLARETLRESGRLGPDLLQVRGVGFAAGDLLVIKINRPDLGVSNGDRVRIVDFDRREMELAVDCDGRRMRLDAHLLFDSARDGGPAVLHGYAVTCHVAQGATVDRAFVLADDRLCREWGYTALTRGRHENHLYVAADRPPSRGEYGPRGMIAVRDPRELLVGALRRSEAESLALDHGRTLGRAEGLGR